MAAAHTPEEIAAHNAAIDAQIAALREKIAQCNSAIGMCESISSSFTTAADEAVGINGLLEDVVLNGEPVGKNEFLSVSNNIADYNASMGEVENEIEQKIIKLEDEIRELQTQYW